jgi:proteic killer suppression protein
MLFQRQPSPRFQAIEKTALRRLVLLDQAQTLRDLSSVPGNRYEPLKGDRAGQHSIRVNDQWRVCFRWDGRAAHDVEIVDYHS